MEANFVLTSSHLLPLPQQLSITTTVACNSVRVRQLSGRGIAYIVVDSANPASPVTMKVGQEYAYLAGYALGANVGSILVNDMPNYPPGELFTFEILQR
jgi:hypothetical protein